MQRFVTSGSGASFPGGRDFLFVFAANSNVNVAFFVFPEAMSKRGLSGKN